MGDGGWGPGSAWVGGEVAALLQGVPVPTRHLVLHVRPDHVERLLGMASKRWHDVARYGDGGVLGVGPVSAEVIAAPVRPASRIVVDTRWRPVSVVDLAELVAGDRGVGPGVRAVAARLPGAETPARRVG